MIIDLPKPECKLGYPTKQLKEILGSKLDKFNKYMVGQTGAVCEGREYDYNKKEYKPSGCGPHGVVLYKCDLLTFLEGRPTLD